MGYRYLVPRKRPTQVQLSEGPLVTAYPVEVFDKGTDLEHIACSYDEYCFRKGPLPYWSENERKSQRMQLGRIAKAFANITITYVYETQYWPIRGGHIPANIHRLYQVRGGLGLGKGYPNLGCVDADLYDHGRYLGLIIDPKVNGGRGAWFHHPSTPDLDTNHQNGGAVI
mgnify:CR=1 FL=1